MRILIDENLPRQLKPALSEHRVRTLQDMGWTGLKDADLLKKAEASFEVLLTADVHLRHPQTLRGMHLILVIFPTNRLRQVEAQIDLLKEALPLAKPGTVVEMARR